MRNMQRILCMLLTLCLLMATLPVSAFAEEMQDMQIVEAFQETEEILFPEEEPLPKDELQELDISVEAILADLPALLEEIPDVTAEAAATETPIATEEPIATEAPVVEGEAALEPTPEPLLTMVQENAAPILLEMVEYIKTGDAEGVVPADLPIDLPEEALPVAGIEGLVCDADYAETDGVLRIKAVWLDAQQGDEITLTIRGSDLNTYLQPIMLLTAGEDEMQTMNSGEYDVSNLFIDGVCVAEGSGEGWSYADGVLQIYLSQSAMTLSGSANLKGVNLQKGSEGESFVLTLGSLQMSCEYSSAFWIAPEFDDNRADVAFNIIGENNISSQRVLFSSYSVTLSGNGVLNTEQALSAGVVSINGPTVNAAYVMYLYLYSGVLNLSGNDEYAVGGLTYIYGGELNIEKNADGLDFKAINIPIYEQSGGKVNINLTGASNYTGICITNKWDLSGGEININIQDAISATGILSDAHIAQKDGNIKIGLSNTQETATGILFTPEYPGIRFEAGSTSISIDGAADQVGIYSKYYDSSVNISGGALDIKLANANKSALCLDGYYLWVSKGSLTLVSDMELENSYALSFYRIMLSGGRVHVLAPSLGSSPLEVQVSGVVQEISGTQMLWEDGELSIIPPKEIFIDGVGYCVYPNYKNISGEGWEYDCDSEILYLNDFKGESIGVYEAKDHFTLSVSGENHLATVELPGVEVVEIFGNGSLNMISTKPGYGRGIDVGGDLRISGISLNMQNYSDGIYAEGLLESENVKLEISGTGRGVICDRIALDAASEWKLQTMMGAVVSATGVTIAGNELKLDDCNEIEIRGGEIIHLDYIVCLQINDAKLMEEDLLRDIAGDGWQWIAAQRKLVLDDFAGIVNCSLDSLHLHVNEDIEGSIIKGRELTLSAEKGVWVSDTEIDAVDLEILSGNYMLSQKNGLLLDNLAISSGVLDVDVLLAGKMKITGGSVRVTDSILYYEDEDGKIYYGLVAENCTVSGGSLYTAEPAFFGAYTQTGGDVEFAKNASSYDAGHVTAVGASTSFTATGGSLKAHNGYGIALFATEINLGGTLTADIYGDMGALVCEKATVAGKALASMEYTTLVMKKGKVEKLYLEEYYGLIIGDEGFTEYMMDSMSFSGKGWSWDHASRTLSIRGLHGSQTKYKEVDIFGDDVTIHLQGGTTNYYLKIVAEGTVTLTGDGKLSSFNITSPKGIKLKNCGNLSYLGLYTNGDISIDNVYLNGSLHYEAQGNVIINNSRLLGINGATGKNLTITGSFVDFGVWSKYECSIYTLGKVSFKNSVVRIESELYAKKGTSISSDAAVFQKNVSKYRLIKSAMLTQDWVLPSGGYEIPSKISLTIQTGKTLYVESESDLSLRWEVRGKVALIEKNMDSLEINGPSEVPCGGSIQLTLHSEPQMILSKISWTISDPTLCSVTQDGLVTATSDPARIGETVTLTAVGVPNTVKDTHEITLIPAAEEISARDANGRYAQDLDLWLDPANRSVQLTAKVYPYNAQQGITWKSSNAKVATVDETGMVTAVAAGSANLYAVALDGSGVQSQAVKVTVRKAPSSIKFATKSPTLGYDPENGTGSSLQLQTTLSSGSASTISFSSSDESIAVVDANGVVAAKGLGSVKITAQTYNGKKATCTVNIKAAPDSVTISPRELTIGVGQTYTFEASIPKNSYGSWFFSTSNACGTINAGTGEFTALKVGDVEVSATTFNGRSDSCIVHVLPGPDVIELSASQCTLGVGEKATLQFIAKTQDGGAATGTYIYETADQKIATVSADGRITAKKVGTTVISVTAHNGVRVECTVRVKKAPGKVTISNSKVTLSYDAETQQGGSYRVRGKITDGNAASALTYSSSNKKVATVTQDGYITAVGVGTAKISVKTFNGKSAACTVTVKAVPYSVTISPREMTMGVGETCTFEASIPENSHGSWTYSVSNDCGSIDAATGKFTALKVGDVEVTVTTSNGKTDTAVVHVLPSPEVIKLNASQCTLGVGEKFMLEFAGQTLDGGAATGTYTYETADKKIATISDDGKITAKKVGSTTITVTAHNGVKATCSITVKKAPKKVVIWSSKETLVYDADTQQGTGCRMRVHFAGDDAASALTYTSSNKKVATVTQDGFISATGVGTAKISVKTFNGKKATCTVTVKAALKTLSFEQDAYAVSVGEVVRIDVKNYAGVPVPEYGSIFSLNPDVIDFDNRVGTFVLSRIFIGKAEGETQVMATAFNGAEGVVNVRVLPEPDILNVAETELTLKQGKKYTLNPEVSRADGRETRTTYYFTTSDAKVAVASQSGQITANGKGTATITVSTHNGLKHEIALKVN